MIGVIFGGMLLPVALSLAGPVYFGISGSPHWRVAIWACACVVGFLWLWRATLRKNLGGLDAQSAAKAFAGIATISAVFFLAGDYLAYFVARSLSK